MAGMASGVDLRGRRPESSVRRVRDRMVHRVPERWLPTEEYLRQIEKGEVDYDSVNPLTLAVIADEYGVDLSELSRAACDDLEAIKDIVLRSRCSRHLRTSVAGPAEVILPDCHDQRPRRSFK